MFFQLLAILQFRLQKI